MVTFLPARNRLIGLACCMISACAATSVAAQTSERATESPAPIATTDSQPAVEKPGMLTGDWGGLRSRLSDHGIDIAVGYVSEFAANLSGGTRHDATETGQFSFDLTIDTAKAFGLDGGTFDANISKRRGHNLVERAGLDTLLQPQEVYGRGQTWRLSEFWYRQKRGIFDLKVGRLTMGDDFASQPCEFENLTFCGDQQGNLVGDYWLNYPVSQWGGRLTITPASWYVMVGAYEYNPNNLKNGIALSHGGAEGVTVPIELGWRSHFGPSGLPGLYRVGGWYSTAHADDVLTDTNGRAFGLSDLGPARRSGRYGGYILFRQQLTGHYVDDPIAGPKTTQGLTMVVNITQTDRRTSRLDNQVALWLTFTGPIASRPFDELGFAIGRNAVNRRAARAELIALPGSEKPDAEYPMELFYAAHLMPWLSVSPNVQYIIHPGGYARATDLVIFGVKSTVAF